MIVFHPLNLDTVIIHAKKTGKRRPVVERPLENTSTDSMLHHGGASHGWSHETLEMCWTCLFYFLSLSVGSFRPTLRRRVTDHVNNACLRDIPMRSGSRHLVDTLHMVD